MERQYTVGQHIVFVDGYGKRHPALVKCWWVQWPEGGYKNDPRFPDIPAEAIAYHKEMHKGSEPGCNLVFVSSDVQRNDNCGRQTEIQTSVVHKSQQVAHGMYWCWPEE